MDYQSNSSDWNASSFHHMYSSNFGESANSAPEVLQNLFAANLQDTNEHRLQQNAAHTRELSPEVLTGPDQNPPAPMAAPARVASRRSRYHDLNWEEHKDKIKELYLDEDRTLQETMRIMKEAYYFDASTKLYKEKIKHWRWQKNLPRDVAQFMVMKADEREREDKETTFQYGELQWTKEQAAARVSRGKKGDGNSHVTLIETPSDITYETPQSPPGSTSGISEKFPREASGSFMDMDGVLTTCASRQREAESESEDDDALQPPALLLSWNGHTRTDLLALFEVAQTERHRGDTDRVEKMLSTVLEGLEHVLSPTHADTNKAAYTLASFYAERDRMPDANQVIETVTQKHIDRYGAAAKETQQHILHTVELLHTWNRSGDALGFLHSARDLVATSSQADQELTRRKRRGRGRAATSRRRTSTRTKNPKDKAQGISDITYDIVKDSDPVTIKYGLDVARSHALAKDDAAEGLLLAIVRNCEVNHDELVTERLEATTELLNLYQRLGQCDQNVVAFNDAWVAVDSIWIKYKWDRQSFKSLQMTETCMKLAAAFLKANFEYESKTLFRRVEEKAGDLYGTSDDRTIWILISIGLVYQSNRGWHQAQAWFQQALAFSYDAYDEKDGIIKSLEQSMDKGYFSYVNDEGRPFKAVFGVNGIVIRPGRLHIE